MRFPDGTLPVFLDRDGTIIVDKGYLRDVEQVEFEAGAVAGLRALAGLGATLVVVTNQSGIGRGLFDRAAVDAVHAHLDRLLRAEGIEIAGWEVCPHAPDDGCDCRKPAAGLVEQAARRLGLDPARGFVIGDKMSDMGLADAIGARGVLVLTGEGAARATEARAAGHAVAADLAQAAEWIGSAARERADDRAG